jgi:hypothetical protein
MRKMIRTGGPIRVTDPRCTLVLWNRLHQRLSDIKLNQISAFSASYSRINLVILLDRGLKLSRNFRTPENDRLHIYSLCVWGVPGKIFTGKQVSRYPRWVISRTQKMLSPEMLTSPRHDAARWHSLLKPWESWGHLVHYWACTLAGWPAGRV